MFALVVILAVCYLVIWVANGLMDLINKVWADLARAGFDTAKTLRNLALLVVVVLTLVLLLAHGPGR